MRHPDTGVSYTANDTAYAAIVAWVNECKANYIGNNACDADELAEDLAYIERVLAAFAEDRNVEKLIDTISWQDTYVRDYYADIVNDLYSLYFGGEWE